MLLRKVFAIGGISLLLTSTAFAKISTDEANKHLFGKPYQAAAAPAADRAKIVYYWAGPAVNNNNGANVYIDGRFHTALQAGGYSEFCLVPGNHTLGAYQHDAPLYPGKTEELYRVKLEAGKTYFIKVASSGAAAPMPVLRAKAEKELQGTHQQKHTISRALIVDCVPPVAKK
ncbi:hypothetical protein ACLBW2_06745 [Enterobacteriaceae bacterium C23F]